MKLNQTIYYKKRNESKNVCLKHGDEPDHFKKKISWG
jgi:hypothetical protein